ncbi:hypothetical protein Q9966_002320 [Columba livia]|nr:hypothetical protein Q9966_002320 [Columba livia]
MRRRGAVQRKVPCVFVTEVKLLSHEEHKKQFHHPSSDPLIGAWRMEDKMKTMYFVESPVQMWIAHI